MRRLEQFSLEQPPGVEVAVRMGLNTYLVIIGVIGDNLRMDYTAVGDTTNMVARLQQAVPGQIIIAKITHRLFAGYCTTHARGELTLSGTLEKSPALQRGGSRRDR